MAEKFIYKDTEVVNFEDILPEVKKHLSEDAYDLFINSDNNLYLGDNGIIYEFEYLPDEDELIRVFLDWEDFNNTFPYPADFNLC